jgi:CheY-like chemotaxis protein
MVESVVERVAPPRRKYGRRNVLHGSDRLGRANGCVERDRPPDLRPPADERANPTSAVGDSRARRVLVVDDEPSMRVVCQVNLSLAGFDVVDAGSGAEALERLDEQAFDLVLLDVMMPDMSGHDLAERLQKDERTRDVPIVFLSARARREDLRRGFELGAVDYITKPFDPLQLGERLRSLLESIDRGEGQEVRSARLAELREEPAP